MRKYTKYVFEAVIMITFFAAAVFFIIAVSSHREITDNTENNAYSNSGIMTELHPQLQEIIEEMRENDPIAIYEHFQENMPSVSGD